MKKVLHPIFKIQKTSKDEFFYLRTFFLLSVILHALFKGRDSTVDEHAHRALGFFKKLGDLGSGKFVKIIPDDDVLVVITEL